MDRESEDAGRSRDGVQGRAASLKRRFPKRPLWLLVPWMALASCALPGDAGIGGDLPETSRVAPLRGCKIVSVTPAVALPAASDGNGGFVGSRSARLRHDADCLPDVNIPSDWHEPYRISFEQIFHQAAPRPGSDRAWLGGDTSWRDNADQPVRQVDASAEGMGKNCARLLARIESETLPCVRAKDPATAASLRAALDDFRGKSRFTYTVQGDDHFNVLRLERDRECLDRWYQVQRLMETPLYVCAVN